MVDVGCGNGVLSAAIAELGAVSIAMDLSESVVRAHEQAKGSGVHFVQADLQVPPFPVQSFDVVYSWGVIHHTNNTELSFSCLHELANRGGLLFVWIYQHLDNRLENMFFGLR